MTRTEILWEDLKMACIKSSTRFSGMEYLVKEYYMKSMHWTEEEALEYAIELMRNGTIEQIKIIGRDGKQI